MGNINSVQLEEYKKKRKELRLARFKYKEQCRKCWRPQTHCFCPYIKSFDPKIEFVILTHPIERRRRIATGRMAHLCLKGSYHFDGVVFEKGNQSLRPVLNQSKCEAVVLYPGLGSLNLSEKSSEQRMKLFDKQKKLCVFVIDGTWRTARRMLRENSLINRLPKISFVPPKKSNFRVRKQPSEECLSTIEAIHHCIELLGPSQGFSLESGCHNHLTDAFDSMVEKQIEYITQSHSSGHVSRHAASRARKKASILDFMPTV